MFWVSLRRDLWAKYNPGLNNYTKPPECVDIIRHTSLGFPSWCPESSGPFSQLVPLKQGSVGLVLSGHQLGKPSDVRWIISTHEGSFDYTPNLKYPLITVL